MESLETQEFFNETLAHLKKMETKLIRLKDEPDNHEIINSVFNSVYTIKRSSIRFGTRYKAPPSESVKHVLKKLYLREKGLYSKILDKLNTIKGHIERIYRHFVSNFFSK